MPVPGPGTARRPRNAGNRTPCATLTWIVTAVPADADRRSSFAISKPAESSRAPPLELWPLPGAIELPVFVIVLVPLAIGVVLGGLGPGDWLAQGHPPPDRNAG